MSASDSSPIGSDWMVTDVQPIKLGDWCRHRRQPYAEVPGAEIPKTWLMPIADATEANRLPFKVPAMFAGCVPGAVLIPRHGFVWTPDDRFIFEGLGAREVPEVDLGARYLGTTPDGRYRLAREPEPAWIPDECVFIGGSRNFGHFIFQVLVRVAVTELAQRIKQLPIAVYDDLPARYLEFLDCVGYTAARRILIPAGKASRFESVWLLSSPMYRRRDLAAMIRPEAIWTIRQAVGDALQLRGGKRPRYFIARGDAGWRRVVNEAEVLKILARHEVMTIDFSGMSATAQMQAIAQAEAVVSVLGAGSAIMMFSSPDCVSIELTPPEFYGVFGPIAFAAVMRQPFMRLVGRIAEDAEVSGAGLEPYRGPNSFDRDFVVDCGQLEQALVMMDRHCRSARRA